MGRAECRRQERAERKQYNKETIRLRPDEIKKIRDKGEEDARRFDIDALLTSFAITMHDQYGFGQKRIMRALGYVDDMYTKIYQEELDITELKKRLREETGVIIK
ncbi:MAG: hypothetical protein LUD12_13320 [Lachnospiraceae bacterium]|nr:hypothetical protein [Lachnospiraceae bacterium]